MVTQKAGLDALVAVQYVAVVRVQSFEAPKVESAEEFTPGAVAGDVAVFDLETGRQLGAYRYAAKNAPNVKVDVSKRDDDLIFDLGSEATRAVVRRFAELAPSASVQAPAPPASASAAPAKK